MLGISLEVRPPTRITLFRFRDSHVSELQEPNAFTFWCVRPSDERPSYRTELATRTNFHTQCYINGGRGKNERKGEKTHSSILVRGTRIDPVTSTHYRLWIWNWDEPLILRVRFAISNSHRGLGGGGVNYPREEHFVGVCWRLEWPIRKKAALCLFAFIQWVFEGARVWLRIHMLRWWRLRTRYRCPKNWLNRPTRNFRWMAVGDPPLPNWPSTSYFDSTRVKQFTKSPHVWF